jgi:rod shape-determining protein MreD
MNLPHFFFLVLTVFLAVFAQAAFPIGRMVLGAQIDLLPPLVVYAALSSGLTGVSLTAIWGGLLFDSLSANPLGTSVAPLLVIGSLICAKRELILRDQVFAQAVIGIAASAAFALLSLLILLHLGSRPTLGWGTLWQIGVTAAGGGILAPFMFKIFGWLGHHLAYGRAEPTSFRPDREIRRGRT